MITLQTKVRVAGEIVSLADVIEMNELDADEVIAALETKGTYLIDAGSNGDSDFVALTTVINADHEEIVITLG